MPGPPGQLLGLGLEECEGPALRFVFECAEKHFGEHDLNKKYFCSDTVRENGVGNDLNKNTFATVTVRDNGVIFEINSHEVQGARRILDVAQCCS